MVGIVIVSHSHLIASGAADLAGQMAGPDVQIEPAGGDVDGGLGTDGARVRAAIDAAESGDGVVILGDLGSAILTVRAVLDGDGDRPDWPTRRSSRASWPQRWPRRRAWTWSSSCRQRRKPVATASSETRIALPAGVDLHARPAAEFVRAAMRSPRAS